MPTPAESLLGLVLDGGWKVRDQLARAGDATGGSFSHGYVVESETKDQAFLKALDYSRALRAPDPARALQALTTAYNFERDLLEKCRDRKMSRIVRALAHGKVEVPPGGVANVVEYLIFELASGGDIRAQLAAFHAFDIAWALRTIHQIATGLWQLHGIGIAHQDLKPSNVLFFQKDSSKLADLGRAAFRGPATYPPPHEDMPIAGDPAYAPPELLYRQVEPDWNKRRLGCDLYQLGSMIVFLCSNRNSTSWLKAKLQAGHLWSAWGGDYKAVLPYVRDAFDRAMDEFAASLGDLNGVKETLVRSARELCDPDPALRGHPKNIAGINQHSLERYVSLFDLLAKRHERGLGGVPWL